MIVGKQLMLFRMTRTSYFVITAINHTILERLVGDSMVALLKVEEVVLVEVLGLGLIILQPLINHLIQALLLLITSLLARKNWKRLLLYPPPLHTQVHLTI
jgi:hypothetical protein